MTEICFANAKLMFVSYIIKINLKKKIFLWIKRFKSHIICFVFSTANMQGHLQSESVCLYIIIVHGYIV